MPPARKQEWSIPLKQAIPILVVGMSMIAFVLSEQADRRELRHEISAMSSDRFNGRDMDLFIERLQVILTDHARLSEAPPIPVPTWRP